MCGTPVYIPLYSTYQAILLTFSMPPTSRQPQIATCSRLHQAETVTNSCPRLNYVSSRLRSDLSRRANKSPASTCARAATASRDSLARVANQTIDREMYLSTFGYTHWMKESPQRRVPEGRESAARDRPSAQVCRLATFAPCWLTSLDPLAAQLAKHAVACCRTRLASRVGI
eukprot:6190832-Pleurochrysis_carterae.AAC.1